VLPVLLLVKFASIVKNSFVVMRYVANDARCNSILHSFNALYFYSYRIMNLGVLKWKGNVRCLR